MQGLAPVLVALLGACGTTAPDIDNGPVVLQCDGDLQVGEGGGTPQRFIYRMDGAKKTLAIWDADKGKFGPDEKGLVVTSAEARYEIAQQENGREPFSYKLSLDRATGRMKQTFNMDGTGEYSGTCKSIASPQEAERQF
jgi:hypothetical protein